MPFTNEWKTKCGAFVFTERNTAQQQKEKHFWDFPGDPVFKTLCYQFKGLRFHPCSGNYDPTWHKARSENFLEKEKNLECEQL